MNDNHPWPVGTNCIGQHFTHHLDRNGMGCVIIGELKERTAAGPSGSARTAPGYKVLWADGHEASVEPHRLRRRTQRQPERRGFIATGLRKILDLFKEKDHA